MVRTIVIEVDPNTTIIEVKKKIIKRATILGIWDKKKTSDSFRLYDYRFLNDSKSIKDYGITNNATLQFIIPLLSCSNLSVHHPTSTHEYNKLKKANNLVVVDFSAEWCGPCRMIAKPFDDYAKEVPDVTFIHIDIDLFDEHPDTKDIRGVPTFKFFKNGKLVNSVVGADLHRVKEIIENREALI